MFFTTHFRFYEDKLFLRLNVARIHIFYNRNDNNVIEPRKKINKQKAFHRDYIQACILYILYG